MARRLTAGILKGVAAAGGLVGFLLPMRSTQDMLLFSAIVTAAALFWILAIHLEDKSTGPTFTPLKL